MGKPSDDHDGDDEVTVADGKAADTEEEVEEEDRGDVVNPEETAENLAKLAKEGETEEEEEEDPEPDEGPGPSRVPKGRLNEVIAERNREREERLRLEEENARLRGGQPAPKKDEPPPKVDLKDLRKQHRAALMEGDEERAAALDDQMDAELERRATERAMAAIAETQAKTAIQEAAAAVVADYPFLDSTAKDANKEAIQDVVDMRNVYISRGKSPAEALMLAAKKIGPIYQQSAKKPAGKKDDDQEPEDADPGKPKSKIDELRQARLRKNATAANAQPTRLDGGIGNRGTGGKVNVEDMTDEAFRGLSEKDKARMRGDVA